jgi:hypothetical protein
LTVKVIDSTTGLVVPGAQIDFSETTSTDATIVNPSSLTDSSGQATAQIKAPNKYKQTILIEARIRGTSSTSAFSLTTLNTGSPTQFAITTSHNLIETAGVPFGFIVSLNDELGNLVDSYNGSLNLTWAYLSAHAWAWNGTVGNDYNLPLGTLACVFVNGICNTAATYVLTDSTQTSLISVGNGTGAYNPIFNKAITVLPGIANKIVFANALSGPSGADSITGTADDATVYSNPSTFITSADAAAKTFYSAITDSYGNFLQNSTTASWTVSDITGKTAGTATSTILPYMRTPAGSSTLTGSAVVITPTLTGSAVVTAAEAGRSGSFNYIVDPGTMFRVVVTTQHSQIETAGVPFNLVISVVDAKGNPLTAHYDGTAAFQGSYSVTASFANDSSAPAVSIGCNRFLVSGDNTFNAPGSFNYPSPLPTPANPALNGCGTRMYKSDLS